ncbi:hypothetical protein GHT06_013261 [Daphnia sinensis]|uniref:Uncharacterized protein n=1 Tax=Daphnia sinensis TaxID=1820382 RepID=A0AAD5KX90_9CRUS|nr:hypothetical protein GHT06_013261 [Daphnia sinensis]
MISLEGEEATHKSELTVNRSRKSFHSPGNLPGGCSSRAEVDWESTSALILELVTK